MKQSTILVPLVTTLFACAGYAQSLVFAQNGQLQSGNFGAACDGTGVADNDSIPDFVGGADRTTPNLQFAGTGTLHSGADGSVIYEYNGNTAFQYVGEAVAGVGDVDNDGRGDFAICTSNEDLGGAQSGRARIYSGRTGGLLLNFIGANAGDGLGQSVDGAGFVNGDSRPDIIVGVPGDDSGGTNAGAAVVYSGSNGSVLHTFQGSVANASFGTSVSKAGDVNNDGRGDVMVGTPSETGATTRGRVVVYSGLDGSALYTLFGTLDDGNFGSALAGPGDLNQDGHDDFIVGASSATLNGITGGAVYVYSGLDGSLLYSYGADDGGDSLGAAVGDGGDIDGDGTPDFLIGVPRSGENGIFSGHVRAISGATGLELFRVFGTLSNERFGTSCAIVGDMSGNGLDDVLAGAPGAAQQRGRCYVFQYDPPIGTNFCQASPNSSGAPSLISASGSAIALEQDLTLTASNQPAPGTIGLFFFGPNQVLLPFGDGFRCVGGGTTRMSPTVVADSGSVARKAVDFGAPYAGSLTAGASFNFQYWFRDTPAGLSGFNLSNGLNIQFQ